MARLCRQLGGATTAEALRLAPTTADSVGLDAAQRAANLVGRVRVAARAAPPPGVRVVLVDDVITTGATLRACHAALRETGVPVTAALVLCDATLRSRDAAVGVNGPRHLSHGQGNAERHSPQPLVRGGVDERSVAGS